MEAYINPPIASKQVHGVDERRRIDEMQTGQKVGNFPGSSYPDTESPEVVGKGTEVHSYA